MPFWETHYFICVGSQHLCFINPCLVVILLALGGHDVDLPQVLLGLSGLFGCDGLHAGVY